MTNRDTIIVGAGPYGLSIGAHLRLLGLPVRVYGKTMEFWHGMPQQMRLKSVFSASTLSDPRRTYSLSRYLADSGIPRQEPIPIGMFVEYGHWFQQKAVPEIDPARVTMVERQGNGFVVTCEDGTTDRARHVVIATGIAPFARTPRFVRELPPAKVSFAMEHPTFDRFAGQRVVVVGAGQSGLEGAVLAHEAGAQAEVIAPHSINWINRRYANKVGPAKHLLYPPTDVGPAGLSWLIHYPGLVGRLPTETRQKIDRRAMRPAGATWLRSRAIGAVGLTGGVTVTQASAHGDEVELKLSDGSSRVADHVLLAAGYELDLNKLGFLGEDISEQLNQYNGYPVLDRGFESSVPGLHFAGAMASHSLGPLCRFVSGSHATATHISRRIRQA